MGQVRRNTTQTGVYRYNYSVNGRIIYLTISVLAVVLFVWTCNNTNVGGLGSPCISNSECGSGLFCADEQCSNGSAGSRCVIDDECADPLVCRFGVVCGGDAGDSCGGDSDCVMGLICADSDTCVLSEGKRGNACGEDGHCDGDLMCVSGVCSMGTTVRENGMCNSDRDCMTGSICALYVNDNTSTRMCALTDGEEDSPCSINGHCMDPYTCDDGVCGRATVGEGEECNSDDRCGRQFGMRAGTGYPGMCLNH